MCKKCPRCGKTCAGYAVRCSCGYVFQEMIYLNLMMARNKLKLVRKTEKQDKAKLLALQTRHVLNALNGRAINHEADMYVINRLPRA